MSNNFSGSNNKNTSTSNNASNTEIKPGMGLLQEVAVGDVLASGQLNESAATMKKGSGK